MQTTATMSRATDPATSRAAAAKVLPHLSRLEGEVLAAIRQSFEGATDRELERLEQFEHYGPSTVRKRRSELIRKGFIEPTGDSRGGCQVWVAIPIERIIADREAAKAGCLF